MKTIIISIFLFVYFFAVVRAKDDIILEDVSIVVNERNGTPLLKNQSTECNCENGHCKRNKIGQVVCECLPEYGMYKDRICKACDCGKNANCTFYKGWFGDEKYCLCPNGITLKNARCKETEQQYSTDSSTTTDWTDPFFSTETEQQYSTDSSTTTDWTDPFFSTGTEQQYFTDSSTTTDRTNPFFSTGTDHQYSTDSSETTDWTEATSSTAGVCDCGKHSIACYLDNEGKKMCICDVGYSQLFDTCIDCYCGEKSLGCFFDESKEKKCLCKEGYAQDQEACRETCKYDRECLNGGICKISYGRVGFCECRTDYSGDRCEINDVCDHFNDVCQRYGAVCVIKDGLPSCECPSDRKGVTGLCENICNPDKCIHGRCEIFGEDFKCRCEAGFEGKYCDNKIAPSKRDGIYFILVITGVVCILIFSIGVLCMAIYFRLKKKAAATDLEKLVNDRRTETISVQQ